jgi:hypothetical protein
VSSRLDWETTYAGLLAGDPVSRAELRVRVQAREILHEHLDLLNELLAEYRLNLGREIGAGSAGSKSSRRRMIAFADLMPSVRIAVDLKVELFRNAAKTWTMNAIHDIDALSMAVPHCHAVVPDSEMANLLSRSQAGQRNGTLIVKSLTELPDLLPGLDAVAVLTGPSLPAPLTVPQLQLTSTFPGVGGFITHFLALPRGGGAAPG